MKNMFKKHVGFSLGIFLSTILFSIKTYPLLPSTLVSHWGAYGEPNGTMTRFWGVALLPIIMLFLGAILLLAPKMAKNKDQFAKVESTYYLMLSVLSVFFMLIQAFIIAVNLGVQINAAVFFSVMMGLLFIVLGRIMRDIPRNELIGIRTPWTLADEEVWSKTHSLANRLFILVGFISLLGAITVKYAMLFLLGSLFPAVVILLAYSYIISRGKKRTP